MRARLRYLAVSPRGPQYLAQRLTEALALLAAIVALVAILAGYSPVVALAQIIVSANGAA